MSPPRKSRRTAATLLLMLLLGPPIGGAVFLGGTALVDYLSVGRAVRVAFPADFWGVIVLATYVFGLVPALLSAIAALVISGLRLGTAQRLAAIGIFGAAISPLIIASVVLDNLERLLSNPSVLVVTMAAGAAAALVCQALVEHWFPLPPREPGP